MAANSLFSLYKRWRHTRGFGVHSPFAYRMVKEVVSPPRGYAYYAEFRPRMDRRERVFYRLGVFLSDCGLPQASRIPPALTPDASRRRASRLSRWLANGSRPIVIERPTCDETLAIESAMEASGTGLLLHSPRFLIAVPRPGMAFLRYDIL